jgi:hypothetical protein
MPIIQTPQQWYELTKTLYDIICKEIDDNMNSAELHNYYPKFVICCEFIRLMRGELFYKQRPLGEEYHAYQMKLYALENNLDKKMQEVREVLKSNSQPDAIQDALKRAKKYFDVE